MTSISFHIAYVLVPILPNFIFKISNILFQPCLLQDVWCWIFSFAIAIWYLSLIYRIKFLKTKMFGLLSFVLYILINKQCHFCHYLLLIFEVDLSFFNIVIIIKFSKHLYTYQRQKSNVIFWVSQCRTGYLTEFYSPKSLSTLQFLLICCKT